MWLIASSGNSGRHGQATTCPTDARSGPAFFPACRFASSFHGVRFAAPTQTETES